ncbi:MAG: flagellar basal body rod protein FlgB [Actinomycetota bacterium]
MQIHDQMQAATHYALQGLAERSEVRAHNVANLNTPGFRAERVDFESTLRAALDRGDATAAAEPARTVDPNLPGPHGNTASLESEMTGMMKDNLTREAMVNAYNWKTTLLRNAITSR